MTSKFNQCCNLSGLKKKWKIDKFKPIKKIHNLFHPEYDCGKWQKNNHDGDGSFLSSKNINRHDKS